MINSFTRLVVVVLLIVAAPAALAQDVRYSWFDASFVQQDIGKTGTMTDNTIGQTVDVSGTDGDGIKFRGSFGTWKNMFAFVDFSSSDIGVDAVVTNSGGQDADHDEFDFTSVRAGVGMKWPLSTRTDVYGAISFDSLDFDFGSFAGENFDASERNFGATIGIRSMVTDKVELRVHIRQSEIGDVDLSSGTFDADVLYGAGFGFELVRGLSIIGDYESGQFSSWNIGFRLDLDED